MTTATFRLLLIFNITFQGSFVLGKRKCITFAEHKSFKEIAKDLLIDIIPSLEVINGGGGGKVGVIGGSTEYIGAPYLSAISALRIGAESVYILTTESAAPVIRTFSSDLIVFAYLHTIHRSKITTFISKMDILIIGPGLGRDNPTVHLILEIIQMCKSLRKPIILNGNGLYAISKNVTIIKYYPSPGTILTPNYHDVSILIKAITTVSNKKPINWYDFWGSNVSVLIGGKDDHFVSKYKTCSWTLMQVSTSRRVNGQRDISNGFLATLLNWALKTNFCDTVHKTQVSHSISAYGASKMIRTCNHYAYLKFGRNLIASDILNEINKTFNEIFPS